MADTPVTRPYPVSVTVDPPREPRNRLTTAFRPILALPHAILGGPIYWYYKTASIGLLGAAAYFMAIVSWFTLLINDEHLRGIREFTLYYLRWRARAVAYMALLVDPYPPFGDAPYPVSIEVGEPTQPRDRVTIALRLLLAIPHFILMFVVALGWLGATVIAWFAILLTGQYPTTVYRFGLGAMRYTLRLEAYMLLLVDEYPPFALE